MSDRRVLRSALLIVAVALFFLSSFGLGYSQSSKLPSVLIAWAEPSSDAPTPTTNQGREVAFIYIGSSTCAFCNDPTLGPWLGSARDRVRQQAADAGVAFSTIGISKDASVVAGIKHLQKQGPFAEIMTGRGWLGEGIRRYVRQDLQGVAATPQIIVTIRDMVLEDERPVTVAAEQLLVRKVGLQDIGRWSEAGSPLPSLATEVKSVP